MNGGDVGHVELNVAEYKHSLPFFFLSINFCFNVLPFPYKSRMKHATISYMISWIQ